MTDAAREVIDALETGIERKLVEPPEAGDEIERELGPVPVISHDRNDLPVDVLAHVIAYLLLLVREKAVHTDEVDRLRLATGFFGCDHRFGLLPHLCLTGITP